MSDYAKIKADKERVEQEYDALVTKLNRCQGQLGSKQAQAQYLSPLEYVEWFAAKKKEHEGIVAELHNKKAVRAEARRAFNGWQPQHKEEWLEWPDCEGWWWFHGKVGSLKEVLTIREVLLEAGTFIITGEGPPDQSEWAGIWKFQEDPELP